jgi:hypothetical protein
MGMPGPFQLNLWIPDLCSCGPPLGALRDVEEVPFPGFTFVGRKRLTPYWTVLVPCVPPENDKDWLPFEGVLAKEMPDAIVK